MKKIAVVGCGFFGVSGLIYASPDICEAIDEAMKEEVNLMGIRANEVIIDDCMELKEVPYEPRHNHKRKPSRYGR